MDTGIDVSSLPGGVFRVFSVFSGQPLHLTAFGSRISDLTPPPQPLDRAGRGAKAARLPASGLAVRPAGEECARAVLAVGEQRQRAGVVPAVGGVRHQLEIIGAVVELVAIPMVYIVAGRQRLVGQQLPNGPLEAVS